MKRTRSDRPAVPGRAAEAPIPRFHQASPPASLAGLLAGTVVAPASVLGLQRTLGNRAVTALLQAARPAPRVVQREITVERVDYNPKEEDYRHGYVDEGAFYAALRVALKGDGALAGFRNQVDNVFAEVAKTDYSARDIPTVADAIVNAAVGEFQTKGLVLGGASASRVRAHVLATLAANLQDDWQMAMDGTESTAFDQLVTIVGEGDMSRAKGTATRIPVGNLPGSLRGHVNAVLDDIRQENAIWAVGAVSERYTMTAYKGEFTADVAERQGGKHYQGNHTNLAGWLPSVPVPANRIAEVADDIAASGSPRLKRVLAAANASDRLGYTGDHIDPANPLRVEYETLRAPRLAALTDAAVKRSAWGALGAGVSAYIEFNIPGGMSRVVFDCVNDRVYITAHYKWRRGFNPFFEVTGFPAL